MLRLTDGMANPLMERKLVGVVFFGVVAMVAVVTSPQLLNVVWRGSVAVVLVVVVIVLVIVVVIVVGVVVVVFVA